MRRGRTRPRSTATILDSLTGLVKLVGGVAQGIASEFGIAPHDLLAMFKLEGVLSMKELAQHMGCDASFITSVADTLERRGFARREPSQRDRRVKNLVLTEEGIAAKERLMRELAAKMPWSYAPRTTPSGTASCAAEEGARRRSVGRLPLGRDSGV